MQKCGSLIPEYVQHVLTCSHVDLEAGGVAVVVMVSSTPHPLWCGCGAGNGGGDGYQASGPCIHASPLSCGLWSESCGLHEGSYRFHSVCRWFITCDNDMRLQKRWQL